MTLPIENYLAFFPATITVGMGWLRRPVRLGPLTIGRAVLLDAMGVDVQRQIPAADVARAAFVLSGEAGVLSWSSRKDGSIQFSNANSKLQLFSRRVKGHLNDLAEAVNRIRDDAFVTYVKPPRREKKVISNTKTGAGWALDFAEALCADYGWSFETAANMPLATVFALAAASLDRYDLRPSCMDYEQRRAAKEKKRHG